MHSRFLLGSGLVLVLVLAALAVWRGTRAGATTVGVVSQPSETLGASEGLHSPAPAEVSLPGARREEIVVSRTPSADVPSELVVRIFEEGGGGPAPGVDVYLQDHGLPVDPELERLIKGERSDVLTGLVQHGRHASTDAEGVARFPGLRGGGTLGAQRGDYQCMRQLDPLEPGPVRVELVHAPRVRVRVVNAQGHPEEGVPVGVRRERGGRDIVRVRSDANGMARLWFGGQRSGAFVGLAILSREPIVAAYSPGAPPAEAIVLTLPPAGTLEVELVDERGASWTRPTEIVAEVSRSTRAELDDAKQPVDFLTCFTSDGRASFLHVGLGLEVRLLVRSEGRADEVELVHGPRTAGERVGARIVLDRPLPELIGRLLDHERMPVGPAWARGTARDARGRTRGGCQAFIDREGRFRHALERPWNAEAADGDLVLELEVDAGGGAVWLASTPLPRLHPGVNDLGELMLDEMPLVASGRLVDDSGVPVRRATVDFLLGTVEGNPYSGELVSQLTTDALGRFELKKALVAERVGIRVTAEGFALFGPLEVPLGAAGLELELERGGTIVCRVQSDGNWMPRLLLERGGQRVSMTVSYSGTGTQELGPLAPGVYTLRYDDPWSDLQGRIEGIVVEAGMRTLDPRLDPLDLRGRMNTVALTVVDAGGHAVPGLVVALERRGIEGFHDCHPKRDGERMLVTAGALPLRIRLEAPGFRSLVLAGVDSDRRVVLERGPRVQVALLGALPELPEHWSLEGWLRREDPSSRIPTPVRGEFTGTAVDLWASDPARYEFGYELVLRYAGKELDRASFVSDPAPVLDVLEQSGTQVFRLSAPGPELVDQMLAYADENG